MHLQDAQVLASKCLKKQLPRTIRSPLIAPWKQTLPIFLGITGSWEIFYYWYPKEFPLGPSSRHVVLPISRRQGWTAAHYQ